MRVRLTSNTQAEVYFTLGGYRVHLWGVSYKVWGWSGLTRKGAARAVMNHLQGRTNKRILIY